MKPKSTLRPLLAAIAGGSLLALSSASGETLPDPLTGAVFLDVSGGPITFSGNSTVSGLFHPTFNSPPTGMRHAVG